MEHPLGNQTAICCHDVWAILEERRQAEEERRERPRSSIQSQSDGGAAIRRLLWTASCDLAYETEYFIEATQIYSEEDRKRRSVKGKERREAGRKKEQRKGEGRRGKERGGKEKRVEERKGKKREEKERKG